MRAAHFAVPLALAGAALLGLGACNSGAGDCPAKETIEPGAPCDDEHLQCAYDLATASPVCDGTTTILATSCACTKGAWSCPSPVSCPSDESGDDAGDDSATGDDAQPIDDAGGG